MIVLVLSAQAKGQSTVLGSRLDQATKPGRPVVPSRVIDPLMSPAEERRLWQILAEPTDLVGDEDLEMDLEKLAERLAAYLPVTVDHYGIESIGLTSDCSVKVPDAHAELPLATVITDMLRDLDLTVILHGGLLRITSTEAAHENLVRRVYDVSALVDPVEGTSHIKELMQLLQVTIEPEIWQDLGGTAVIVPWKKGDRWMLVVSAPTVNHWQIDSLLNGMMDWSDADIRASIRLHRSHVRNRVPRSRQETAVPRAKRLPRGGQAASPAVGEVEATSSAVGEGGVF